MAGMYYKYKTWISLINNVQFDGLDQNIKSGINLKDDNCQKYLMNSLKNLAHVCFNNEEAQDKGCSAAKITMCLINQMTITEDCMKPMFFMVKYLLKQNMFSETRRMCDYLIENRVDKFEENFIMICKAWEKVLIEFMIEVRDKFSRKNYNTFFTILEHYFMLAKASIDSHGKYIFRILSKFIAEMERIKDERWSKKSGYLDFVKSTFCLMKNVDPHIHESVRTEIEPKILGIFGKIMQHLIDTDDMDKVSEIVDLVCPVLLRVLVQSSDLHSLMITQLNLAKALMRPHSTLNGTVIMKAIKYIKSESSICAPWLENLLYYWYCQKANILQECPLQLLDLVLSASQRLKYVELIPYYPECSTEEPKSLHPSLQLRITMASILPKLPANEFNSQLLIDFLTSCVSDVHELKLAKCSRWFSTWMKVKTSICIIAQTLSKCDIDHSITLYCTLCSGIANLEDTENVDTSLPVGSILTKIACTYYNSPKHIHEALISAAFASIYNFESDNHKCFRIWNGVKQRELDQFKELTMVECLKTNACWIEDIGIKMNLSKYNLANLCVYEIVSHLEGSADMTDCIVHILDEIDQLEQNCGLQYARGVQLLGFYVGKRNIRKHLTMFVERARKKLKKEPDSLEKSYLQVSLEFCDFIDSLNDNKRISESEIEVHDRLMNLNKKKLEENNDKEKDDGVVASFAAIGVKHDEILMERLAKVQQNWREFFLNDLNQLVNIWEPKHLMNVIMLSAEYSKLYGYHSCEILAWKMALKLANAINDSCNYVRVVTYLMAARFVRNDWIDKAKEHIITLEKSSNLADVRIAQMFHLQFVDYYLKLGKQKDALQLLHELHQNTNLSIQNRENCSSYLQLMMKSLMSYNIFKPDAIHGEYATDLLTARYGILNLSYYLDPMAACPLISENSPLASSVFFDAISHLYLHMDSGDFRDFQSHMPLFFRIGQNLACTKRLGDLLKILVVIDLNKGDMLNCEIKLSALEKILDIEIKQPKPSLIPKKVEQKVAKVTKSTDLLRDASCHYIRSGSIFPELQKQTLRYTKPGFLSHKSNCACYKCKSLEYQALVFAATALRARFHAISQNTEMALQYYKGAYDVRRMFADSEFKYIKSKENNIAVKSFWCSSLNLVEWVLFLLNYCEFLKTQSSNVEDALSIGREALDICESRLPCHIVYNKVQIFINEYLHVEAATDCTIPNNEDVSDLLEGLESTSSAITSDRSPVLEQRKKLEKTKRAPPVNHRKRSPKRFVSTRPSLKVTLQEAFIKSPPVIFTDAAEGNQPLSKDKTKPIPEEALIKPPSPICIDSSTEDVQIVQSQSSSRIQKNQTNRVLQETVHKPPQLISVEEPTEDVKTDERQQLLKENQESRVTTRRHRSTRRAVNYAESPQANDITKATEMLSNMNLDSAEDKKQKKRTRNRRKISEELEEDMFAEDTGTKNQKPKTRTRKNTQTKDVQN